MTRGTVIVSIVGISIFLCTWVGSPFFTTHQMIAAAEAGNDDDVLGGFDIAKVRENMRPSLTALAQPDEKDVDDNPASGFELMAAPRLAGAALDSVLTPGHVSDLVRYGIFRKPDGSVSVTYSARYLSPNVFALSIGGGNAQPAVLTFERNGLFSWKVSRIAIPEVAQQPDVQASSETPPPAQPDTAPVAPPQDPGTAASDAPGSAPTSPSALPTPAASAAPAQANPQPLPDPTVPDPAGQQSAPQ